MPLPREHLERFMRDRRVYCVKRFHHSSRLLSFVLASARQRCDSADSSRHVRVTRPGSRRRSSARSRQPAPAAHIFRPDRQIAKFDAIKRNPRYRARLRVVWRLKEALDKHKISHVIHKRHLRGKYSSLWSMIIRKWKRS